MLTKFALDDKVDLMNANKRRTMITSHKVEADRLWNVKKQAEEDQKNRD